MYAATYWPRTVEMLNRGVMISDALAKVMGAGCWKRSSLMAYTIASVIFNSFVHALTWMKLPSRSWTLSAIGRLFASIGAGYGL